MTYTRKLAVGDLNGDNTPDLAVTYSATAGPSANVVGVLLGHTDGATEAVAYRPITYFPVGIFPTSVTTADFDGDGDLDLAVTNLNSDSVSVLLNNGSAGFFRRGPGTYRVGDAPGSVVAADFNGDGRVDLAVANRGGGDVTVLLGAGSGVFRPGKPTPTTFTVGGSPAGTMAVGDFNGDGLPDLAVPVSSGRVDAVSVLLNLSGDVHRPGHRHGRI